MITDSMTKTQFVVEILNRDIDNIFKAQRLIAEKSTQLKKGGLKEKKRSGRIGTASGRLLASLNNPKYTIAGVNGKFQVQAYIPLHMRFFDMKHLGNWEIYNRQVWGILYRNTLIDLKYGYGRQLRNLLGGALDRAFNDKK